MDYEFFESLTEAESQALLSDFRASQEGLLENMMLTAPEELRIDYSVSSLSHVLKWILQSIHVHWTPLPDEEPAWIPEAHPKGLLQFDEDSKALILLAAYYLGECFARLPGLRWTTGDPQFMGKNMPVIAGFYHDQELAPLVVIENVFARILGDGSPLEEIDRTINVWRNSCPVHGD